MSFEKYFSLFLWIHFPILFILFLREYFKNVMGASCSTLSCFIILPLYFKNTYAMLSPFSPALHFRQFIIDISCIPLSYCLWYGKVLAVQTYFACFWTLNSLLAFIRSTFPLLSCFCSFTEGQLTVFIWIYFCSIKVNLFTNLSWLPYIYNNIILFGFFVWLDDSELVILDIFFFCINFKLTIK